MPPIARFVLAGFYLMCTLPAFAMDDTPQNRELEANRYLQAVPPDASMSDLLLRMAVKLPPAQREAFVKVMKGRLDMKHAGDVMRDGLVKIFTAGELQALADFYGSAAGKAAMAKMGTYMAEVMPPLMQDVDTVLGHVQQEMAQTKKEK